MGLDFSHNDISGQIEIHDWHFNAMQLKRINNGIGKLIIHAKGLISLDATNNRLTSLDILGETPKNMVHFD
ncbi:MAG: hypothetical protein H7240_00795 [Glaciimonas sp.]|nr:hypothetical protein [Glaciimonas sp.]